MLSDCVISLRFTGSFSKFTIFFWSFSTAFIVDKDWSLPASSLSLGREPGPSHRGWETDRSWERGDRALHRHQTVSVLHLRHTALLFICVCMWCVYVVRVSVCVCVCVCVRAHTLGWVSNGHHHIIGMFGSLAENAGSATPSPFCQSLPANPLSPCWDRTPPLPLYVWVCGRSVVNLGHRCYCFGWSSY